MPKATAAVIIEKEGKILLTKRNVDPYRDYWVPPGGYIDKNEKAIDTAIREVKEEVDLDVNPKFLFYCDEICPDHDVHNLLLVFHATAEGKVKINEECTEYKWVTVEEALKMKLGFLYHEVLRKWADERN